MISIFEACCLIRKYFNKSAITTDLIVGFPGETDDEFLETINYVKISLAQGHVFKYSKRTGTRAETMPNQVNDNIKNTRSIQLIKVCEDLENEYLASFNGNEECVLVEDDYIYIDNEIFSCGHTKNYTKVAVRVSMR